MAVVSQQTRPPRWAAAALGALAVACATTRSPIVRPSTSVKPTILNEATGQQYEDCRKAFAEATADTVLTFSAGVFRCGAEIAVTPDWLVVRGAGLGQTYLDASEQGKESADLTAFRVSHVLRVQDLAFGGLLDLTSDDSRAELIRVGMATTRPALIGGPSAQMAGSAIIVHSVLAGSVGKAPSAQPKPLALIGHERIGLMESVLIDVEQEFERFPAPGVVVLLSKGMQEPFSRHEPGDKSRRDPSKRPNVACGAAKGPAVFCASEGQAPVGPEPLALIASRLLQGKSLRTQEPALRGLGAGFAARFRKGLGGGLRQPEVFWFDDSSAKLLQDEAGATGPKALAVLAQSRLSTIVELCRHTEKPIRTILETASILDRLMKTPTAEPACREQLKTQANALVSECGHSWDWDRVLAGIANADEALDMKGATLTACRAQLSARLPASKVRGPLTDTYVRNLAGQLQLKYDDAGDAQPLSLVSVLRQMPAVITKSDRPAFNGNGDLLDRIIATAQMPGAGDGRKLVETTEPCQLPTGTAAVRVDTKVSLGELPPHAKSTDLPRTVMELPVEVSKDEIASTTAAGSVNIALVKRCDEKVSAAYRQAVRRYVVQELTRLAQEGTDSGRLEADLVLQMVRAEHPEAVPSRTRRLPTVAAVLSRLSDDIRAEPLEIAPVSMGSRHIEMDASDEQLPPPPDWSASDFAHAADLLAGAHVVGTAACRSFLPDVPWQDDGAALIGGVVLESAPLRLRCLPGEDRFDLSLDMVGKKLAPKVLATLQKLLTDKLGASKAQKRDQGPALVWEGTERTRSAVLYKKPSKAGQVVGTIGVPTGSGWK
jgi:hypothetical protein